MCLLKLRAERPRPGLLELPAESRHFSSAEPLGRPGAQARARYKAWRTLYTARPRFTRPPDPFWTLCPFGPKGDQMGSFRLFGYRSSQSEALDWRDHRAGRPPEHGRTRSEAAMIWAGSARPAGSISILKSTPHQRRVSPVHELTESRANPMAILATLKMNPRVGSGNVG